ncbi:probable arabinosyltransferase ARAD1 [Tanacetum coccineum]|uniref:Probable arabinosyltransferase ARAD1 n=1 Tax=Tanacetum coccineum TaxID=301880 RepID=A0ABQ4WDA7_9ASTR
MDSRECSRVLIVCIGIGEIVQSPYMVNLKDAIINTLTLMLEAVADQKLWIRHAYFRVPGANNDINVLYGFPLFDDVLVDRALEAPFVVKGKTYNKDYYLAGDIYPTWATFVQTYSIARDEKTMKFKRVQESGEGESKKPQRHKSGTQALREIRRLQKTVNLIVSAAPFI